VKKNISIVVVLLLLVSGVYIYKYSNAQINPNDFIIKVDTKTFIKTSEDKVLNFYEKNKEDLKALATYLLANEKVLGAWPFILDKESNRLTEKITDESIKKMVNSLLEEGTIKQISSLHDDFKDANFTVGSEFGVYEQGIRYVSDPQVIDKDKTNYNYVKEYKELDNGWYYYLFFYNQIKDADVYKKIAWDNTVTESERKFLKEDWHKAIVTLEDWDLVFYKMDHKEREFVISVYYDTDDFLGPCIVYLDPVTKKIVGSVLRM